MKRKKILKTILLAVLLSGVAATFYIYKEYNRKSDVLTNIKPAFTEDCTELNRQFTNNEKAATTKYSDKVILVTGNIKAIEKDEKGFCTIVLGDTSSMSSVRCSIDSNYTSEALLLKISTNAGIKGICTGFNADEMGLGSDVILNKCVLVK